MRGRDTPSDTTGVQEATRRVHKLAQWASTSTPDAPINGWSPRSADAQTNAGAMAEMQSIGVLSPLGSGFYFGGVINGIRARAAAAGFATVAFQSQAAGADAARDSQQWPLIRPVGWSHVAGFVSIIAAASDASLQSVLDAGKPLVLVSHHVPSLDVPVVVPDNGGGIRQSVRHLVAHGHERIAFVGQLSEFDIMERYDAFRVAIAEHGITADPALVYSVDDMLQGGGEQAARLMLAAGLPSTAVVAGTDLNAVGIMRALSATGLRVPKDQAIVGFDDGDDARHARPSLSTVAQDFAQIGWVAADLVIRQLDGERVDTGRYQIATRFVARKSCGCSNATRGDVHDAAQPPVASSGIVALPLAVALSASHMAPHGQTDIVLARVAETITAALVSDDAADLWPLREAVDELWEIVRPLDDLAHITDLLREGIEKWLAAAGSAASASPFADRKERLEKLLVEVTVSLAAAGAREQFLGWRQLQDSLSTQYEVGMSLLRGGDDASTGLDWLSMTTASSGVLALPSADDESHLAIHSRFDRRGQAAELVADVLPERDFPSQGILERAMGQPDGVVLVIPVLGAGKQCLLVVVASVENRDATGHETFHQWAALLGVALDHQQVWESLRRQQVSLAESLDREQRLAADIGRSEQRYALAAAAANDGLWDWDLATGSVYYSDRSLAILGCRTAAANISGWLKRVHPDDSPGLVARIAEQRLGTSEPLDHEHRVFTDDGETRWVLCRGLAVSDGDNVTRIVGSLTDVTDRRALEDRLRQQALYDGLTALPNRVLLLERLGIAVQRAKADPDYRFAVLFIDLDGFKVINDSLGHVTGDKLLNAVAERLQSFVRAGDTAARLGGDEFVIVLDDLAPSADVPSITKRLLETLAVPFDIDGGHVAVTASIGIITTERDLNSAEDMLRDADIAMYRAKTAGRGGFANFDATMRLRAVHRMSVETRLRAAVAEGAFELHYQPIVAIDNAEVHSFEALIRWPNRAGGLTPPAEFLPVADDTGLIVPIGRWVIERVCRQLREWRDSGHAAAMLPVSINLSNKEFWDAGLLPHIDDCLAEYGLPAGSLILEITEGVIMHNAHRAEAIVDAMHQRGHAVHIDDFGTGYSSLGALHSFPIDALKIDRSFVVAMSNGTRSAELAHTIVMMGVSLGLDVIAEGIEEPEQRDMLVRFGCTFGQGFLYSEPLAAHDVAKLFPGALRAAAGRTGT
ncbi:MAG: hypothetical protein JWM93_138 [Frankiales bacterium]|nr:hypothetical protein [Frankiales bacterium]